MPKKLVSTATKEKYKRLAQQLVLDLSQPLVVVQESPLFIKCPNCLFDSINKKSANIFDASFTVATIVFSGTDQQRTVNPVSFTSGRCPVCLGEGQLFTPSELCIPAMVNFSRPDSEYHDLASGKEGSHVVVVKTLACYYDLLRSNHTFVINGYVKCEKIKPPFVRGLGGVDSVCEMWLQATEAGERATGDFASDPAQTRNIDPRRLIKGPSNLRLLRGQFRGK